MEPSGLTLTKEPGAAKLVLHRPARRNAITLQMWRELPALLATAAADDDVRLLLVTGDRDFSTGADIGEFEAAYATRQSAADYLTTMEAAIDALAAFSKPTVALISGVCIGAACGLALACDLRIGDDSARFAVTPAKLGMSLPISQIRRLIEAVGVAGASDMLFSARTVGAEEALRLGLLNRLVTPNALQDAGDAYVAQVAGNAPGSLHVLKQLLSLARVGHIDTEASAALFLDALEQSDFVARRDAFLAGRPAHTR